MPSRSFGRYLALSLAGLLGCTSTEVVAPRAVTALARSTSRDTIRLPTADGGFVEFGPNATLYVDGIEVPASELYWNESGLFRKDGELISSWDDLSSVKVEQVNGAATVAVSATAAVAIVALAVFLKNLPGGSGSKGTSAPSGKAASTPSGRSAPNPPSVPTDPALTEVVFRTAEAMGRAPFTSGSVSGTPDDETDTAIPLFSRGARRRANVRAIARLEGAACWPGGGLGDCVVGGARAGVRIVDMFELTGGIRTETSGSRTDPLAVVGAILHGELPSAHWFALAVGASVAFDGNHAHVVPTFGLRFRPVQGLWLGVVPVQPVYSTDTGNWTMASGIEITGEL